MQSDIVQRLRAASQGMRSHYKVGAVELIPTHTMDEAAAEITRLTEALRAAEEREKVLRHHWAALDKAMTDNIIETDSRTASAGKANGTTGHWPMPILQ